MLVPVAAAFPAGEAVDEFTFSSSGLTFSKGRASMDPLTLEQVTVIRMFIRNMDFRSDNWRIGCKER